MCNCRKFIRLRVLSLKSKFKKNERKEEKNKKEIRCLSLGNKVQTDLLNDVEVFSTSRQVHLPQILESLPLI